MQARLNLQIVLNNILHLVPLSLLEWTPVSNGYGQQFDNCRKVASLIRILVCQEAGSKCRRLILDI